MSRNNGISSPTNNNIRNVNVHHEGVVDTIADQDEEARKLKVHEVFAKMKDTLEKKRVMDGRSSRHLLPHDELVSVFKASLLLIEIIY